ncbi:MULTISPECIES: NAD(P)/FAD-dependent oxidoreductase [unclassified Nocardioides]|uniref:NAD(P)/FAD-dependent oxidoreductase n=1 Tax=unclassified Nocardioides TaxID=2615069 RepID=UPI00070033D1|nr:MULTISPECIES: FAD-dependent oxidoreductase [unclassified Nocardioides]KQY50993.1 pyridine nucleotide-disulfide oxidoreductase [Nocardioides sp. Root140]KQZ75633.1 pyridine nucleotide-disulfide oxidoreductase [Nocardioides sp. Root151]KRF14701.1 pyridine nucleotide-disulfide oxidoreductase [Nocardioides sp. Soil796]
MRPNADHVVVVGASLAGLRAVQTARQLGFAGRLTLVGAEEHLPYDRPPLSKEMLHVEKEPSTPALPGAADLHELNVECLLGTPATALDVQARRLTVGEQQLSYDAVLIATGARPRRLPGTDSMAGVHCLRTLEDSLAVRSALDRGARTVVVGAGFIGAEVASAARRRHLPVTVVEAMTIPLTRAVGETAGASLSALHARHGTDLRCDVSVEAVVGTDRVEAVRLSDGSIVPADLVVVGIGAEPVTDWLESSSLTIDNGVVTDANLLAGHNVWVAGDVARWHSSLFDRHLRLEHWTNAGEQGAHAMQNLLQPSEPTPYEHVPYFWSEWYGQWIQMAGLPEGEPEVVTGTWDAEAFVALYRQGERLVGALAMNRRGDIMKYRTLIARGATWQDALELASKRNERSPVPAVTV